MDLTLRTELGLLADSRDAEYFRAPTTTDMEKLQSPLWRSVHSERTDPPQPITIAERLTPFRLLFDFSPLDVSDTILLRVDIEIFGPNPSQRRWVMSEEHRVKIYSHENITHLEVNDQPISRGRLLELSPMTGPWVARVQYAQTLGFSKTVRVALLP